VPVSFSLLSSAKEKNRLAPMAEIDRRTNGFKRRAESLRKAPEALKDLVMQARHGGITADYLLFDSWFAFPATILGLLKQKQQVICMLKAMKTITYGYQGFDLTLGDLYKSVRKRGGRAKILASALVELGTDDKGKPVMAKIVFVRNRSTRKWLALLSTDVNLSDEEIVKLYKRRWDIEVFFKIINSYPRLAKEFQSRGYDALVAHTTIVFASYIMLEFKDGPAIMQRWLDRRSGRSPGAGCGPAVARASSAAGFFHNRSLAGIPSSDGHSTVRRPVSSRRIDWIPVRGTTAMAIAAFSSTGRADRVSMARISTAPPARVTLAIRVRL